MHGARPPPCSVDSLSQRSLVFFSLRLRMSFCPREVHQVRGVRVVCVVRVVRVEHGSEYRAQIGPVQWV